MLPTGCPVTKESDWLSASKGATPTIAFNWRLIPIAAKNNATNNAVYLRTKDILTNSFSLTLNKATFYYILLQASRLTNCNFLKRVI